MTKLKTFGPAHVSRCTFSDIAPLIIKYGELLLISTDNAVKLSKFRSVKEVNKTKATLVFSVFSLTECSSSAN